MGLKGGSVADRMDCVDEILEFAISREVKANQLYMYMAKRTENPEISAACEELAKEELEHKAKLKLEVMKRGQMASDFDVSDYMMDVSGEMDMDYQELLVFAIKSEETAIKIYTDLAAVVKDAGLLWSGCGEGAVRAAGPSISGLPEQGAWSYDA